MSITENQEKAVLSKKAKLVLAKLSSLPKPSPESSACIRAAFLLRSSKEYTS
jgi:hypothetical protein